MIGYVTLGSNDMDKACSFYSQLVAVIGGKELMRFSENFILYGVSVALPGIAVVKPYDGGVATAGNGAMVAIVVDERAKVDALYAKAMELGAHCEGPAGLRGEEGPHAFYGAYFRDLDGNKLCAFRTGPA